MEKFLKHISLSKLAIDQVPLEARKEVCKRATKFCKDQYNRNKVCEFF